jgi:two-component system, response regulator PdtaR
MYNKRVIVVEDEILIQLYVVNVLKKLGCEIVEAIPTGEEAVEIAKREKPDLILMDIKLAGIIDGIEAISQLASIAPFPVVIMSAFEIDEKIKDLKYPGPIFFLSKPIEISKLKNILEQC